MTIDKHTVALISIVGSSLDMLGALYLAYDLLGGEHGPLRTLTRAVTYGALFGVGYGLVLGPFFGVENGVAHGLTLGWEYSHAARGGPRRSAWYDAAMSGLRSAGFAVGGAHLYGWTFGIIFGAAGLLGQMVAYRFGMRPDMDYQPGTRPRFTGRQFLGVLNRTVGYAVTGYVSALVAQTSADALSVGLRFGLMIGAVTAVGSSLVPLVEWGADHVPEKRMGVAGVGLILLGFTLTSVQYWLAVLDVNVVGK